MIFVCGSIGPKADTARARAVMAMAGARRTAAAHAVIQSDEPGCCQASADCRVLEARQGDAVIRLFMPALGPATASVEALASVAGRWIGGQELDLSSFDGPFLAVAWDAGTGCCSLANDRFGMCPVYFAARGGELYFATDLHALVEAPGIAREIDPQAIYDYVFFHHIPAPRSIYRGVRKLGPAERLDIRDQGAATRSYWQPKFAAPADPSPQPSALLPLLEQAVAERATGQCGAFLSGGLDSSSVAGLLKRARGHAETFTIGFDAEGYDESPFARVAARHFATEHHEYFAKPDDVLEALPIIAAHYGEPFGNSSVVPAFLCARFARSHGIELLLAGDGGDELFAGNTRYVDQAIFERYFRFPAAARWLLETGYRVLPILERLPVAGKGARYIAQAKMGLPDRLQSYNFLHRFSPDTVFTPEWLQNIDREEPWNLWRQRYNDAAAETDLQRMLYLDWKFTLADNDLVKVNQMCDLAGIEVCYPMLDGRVVDLSCRVSAPDLLHDGRLRGYYKRAVETFLPGEIIQKEKHGFGLPFGVWMRDDVRLRDLGAQALEELAQRGIFRPEFLRETRRLHQENTASYYGELVWILTMFELWMAAH